VEVLSGANRIQTKAYACIFDQIPGNWKREGMVSAHAMELHYVFGVLDDTEAWNSHLNIFKTSGAKSYRPLITHADREISKTMMKIWAQFARTGNPNIQGMVTWPAWHKETDDYLYIAEQIQVKSGYSRVAQPAKQPM
jgi:para-nitrobenzyl esterase